MNWYEMSALDTEYCPRDPDSVRIDLQEQARDWQPDTTEGEYLCSGCGVWKPVSEFEGELCGACGNKENTYART